MLLFLPKYWGSMPPYPLLRRPCHEMRCAKFTKSPHVQPPEPNHPSSITLAGPLPNTSGRKKTYLVDSIQDWSFRLGYRISSYSFRGNYSFFNLEIVVNSNSCCNISISYLINCISACGNYSRAETIQGRKLYEEIRYPFCAIENLYAKSC